MNEYDEGWVESDWSNDTYLKFAAATMDAKRQAEDGLFKHHPVDRTDALNYVLRAPMIRMRPVPGKHPRLARVTLMLANGLTMVDGGLSWLANKVDDARRWLLDRTETWRDHKVYDGMMPAGSVQYKPFETSTSNYPDPPEGMPF